MKARTPQPSEENALRRETPGGTSLSFATHKPYLLAVTYTVLVSWVLALAFDHPPPRFMDVYLAGAAIFCARWSKGPALLIFVTSLVFGSWMLPRRGSLVVSEGHDIYRMVSYTITSIVVIETISFIKRKKTSE